MAVSNLLLNPVSLALCLKRDGLASKAWGSVAFLLHQLLHLQPLQSRLLLAVLSVLPSSGGFCFTKHQKETLFKPFPPPLVLSTDVAKLP